MNDGLYQAVRTSSPPDRRSEGRCLRPRSDSWRRRWTTSAGTARSSARRTRPSCRRSRSSSRNVDDGVLAERVGRDERVRADRRRRGAACGPAGERNARPPPRTRARRAVEGWRFTLHAPSMIPVLDVLGRSRGIRERVWRAYNSRAASGERDNRPDRRAGAGAAAAPRPSSSGTVISRTW